MNDASEFCGSTIDLPDLHVVTCGAPAGLVHEEHQGSVPRADGTGASIVFWSAQEFRVETVSFPND